MLRQIARMAEGIMACPPFTGFGHSRTAPAWHRHTFIAFAPPSSNGLRLHKLASEQLGIKPVLRKQLRVRSTLDDAPFVHHQDQVRALDR